MENVTFEEMSLMCIYNSTGTREGLIDALTEMRGYLGPDGASGAHGQLHRKAHRHER